MSHKGKKFKWIEGKNKNLFFTIKNKLLKFGKYFVREDYEYLLLAEDIKVIETLDKIIDRNKSNKNLLLYRNVNLKYFDVFGIDDKLKSGLEDGLSDEVEQAQAIFDNIIKNKTVFQEKGFMSTSYDKELNAFTGCNVHIEIKVPKGYNMYVTDNVNESEVILKRNTKYNVESFEPVKTDECIFYKLIIKVIK